MKSISLLLFLILLLNSCSLITKNTSFVLKSSDNGKAACTFYNPTDGAVIFEYEKALVRFEIPWNTQSPFIGPLLLPVFPNILNPRSFESAIRTDLKIEVLPLDGASFEVKPSDIKIFHNERPVSYLPLSYREKVSSTLATVYIPIKSMNQKIKSTHPTSIFYSDRLMTTPNIIELNFRIKINDRDIEGSAKFERDTNWTYEPIWVPTQDMRTKCKTKNSYLKKGRYYLL